MRDTYHPIMKSLTCLLTLALTATAAAEKLVKIFILAGQHKDFGTLVSLEMENEDCCANPGLNYAISYSIV
jgi:hypothetical protein